MISPIPRLFLGLAFSCFVRLASAASIPTAVTLAPIFTDGAVLQRDRPVPVWGRAAPGQEVRVAFGGHEVRARADAAGRWQVALTAMPADRVGRNLVVRGKTEVIVRDVLVGDVWLCSGQSNMGRTVAREIAAGVKIPLSSQPTLRHFEVGHVVAESPQDDFTGSGWRAASPENTGTFTAIGYLVGRELERELGVPIGLIHSSWGGTPIESWTDAAIFRRKDHPAFAGAWAWWKNFEETYPAAIVAFDSEHAKWVAAGSSGREPQRPHGGPGDPWRPGVLFNGMIYPLAPYSLKGVLWYQGENNANDRRADQYCPVFTAMIQSWRALFQEPDLPFLWVQLPNYNTNKDWAELREAQSDTLAVPHTGQAVSIDIGDPHDIHPHNKIEVARRLALVALAKVYGRKVVYSGPRYVSATPEGGGVRVTFANASEGLVVHGESVNNLELAGTDRVFYPAQGRIDGSTLIVTSPQVPEPKAVRYAWSNNPSANLYNRAGLPAAPFRSERW